MKLVIFIFLRRQETLLMITEKYLDKIKLRNQSQSMSRVVFLMKKRLTFKFLFEEEEDLSKTDSQNNLLPDDDFNGKCVEITIKLKCCC